MKIDLHEDYVRSAMFGFQDGLVSTTGVVVGIATGAKDPAIILLASFVAVSVEATSMAAGQYSSEKAVHQMDKTGKHTDSLIIGAVIMFFAYFIAGLVPIIPMLFYKYHHSTLYSITFALIGLFLIGFVKGKYVKVNSLTSAVEMLIIGSIATAIGLIVGFFLSI